MSTAFSGGAVQASWNTVSDPESSVIRYLLYRDGDPLAEFDADVLSYADSGYEIGGPNSYQVRALNGAFVESAACPAQSVDVISIFSNGFE